jgi:archaellin
LAGGAIGSIVKRIAAVAFASALALGVFAGVASADVSTPTIRIEQVRVDLPEIRVNFYVDDYTGPLAKGDVKASFGGEALETESVEKFTALGGGITWYMLVDISGSITENETEAVKSALDDFVASLGAEDKFILIPVGETAAPVLTGDEALSERETAIDGLDNKDKRTVLYDSIDKAFKLSEQSVGDLGSRDVAVAITDGADDTAGGHVTEQGAKDVLASGDMPLYALGFSADPESTEWEKEKAALDKLGDLVRTGGGEFREVSASTLGSALEELVADVKNSNVAVLKSEDNSANREKKTLTLTVNAGDREINTSMDVVAVTTTKDDKAPEIKGAVVQLKDKNGVKVYFTKPLLGADNKDSYLITDEEDGKSVEVKTVAYRKENGEYYTDIIFADKLYSGNYKISFVDNITDTSNEKNPLKDSATFSYEGASGLQKWIDLIFGQYWWAVCIAAAVVIVLLVLRYIRRRGGLVRVDGKIGFGDMIEFRQRFETPPSGCVSFIVTDTKGVTQRVDLDINKSVFIGRSGVNNLSFNDDKMSRQHFVIEIENGEYFITDLNTTNGTFLNGIPVKGKRKIANNDVITAGREKLVFKAQGQG